MKLLIKLIGQRLKQSGYYQEVKELSMVGLLVFMLWVLKNYGIAIAQWVVSEKGLICTASVLSSVVLGLTLKIFYRMMAIKYHEKSTEIGLFEYLNNQNN